MSLFAVGSCWVPVVGSCAFAAHLNGFLKPVCASLCKHLCGVSAIPAGVQLQAQLHEMSLVSSFLGSKTRCKKKRDSGDTLVGLFCRCCCFCRCVPLVVAHASLLARARVVFCYTWATALGIQNVPRGPFLAQSLAWNQGLIWGPFFGAGFGPFPNNF